MRSTVKRRIGVRGTGFAEEETRRKAPQKPLPEVCVNTLLWRLLRFAAGTWAFFSARVREEGEEASPDGKKQSRLDKGPSLMAVLAET